MNWYKLSQALARPAKPQGTVTKRNLVKNPGTNTARQMIQYHFTTSLGNDVKVQMFPKDPGQYSVLFYVNDTLDDNASKTDGATRDSEILPGVLHIMKDKAKRLKANVLEFEAHQGAGDNKVTKNLDPKPYLDIALQHLRNLYTAVNNHQETMKELSPSLIQIYRGMGMTDMGPRPDLDKKSVINKISYFTSSLMDNGLVRDPDNVSTQAMYLSDALRALDLKKFNIDASEAIASLNNLRGAISSNSEAGWTTKTNRRAAIYEKLMNRYFADEWDITRDNKYFVLKRKENELV